MWMMIGSQKEIGKCGQQQHKKLRCSSPPINRGHQKFKQLSFLVRYPYQSNELPLLVWRGASQSRIKTSRDFMNWNFNNQQTKVHMFNQCSRDSKFFHMFHHLRVAIFYPKNDNEKMPRNPANELSLHFYGPLNNLMYRFFWQSMLQHAVQQACEICVKTFITWDEFIRKGESRH